MASILDERTELSQVSVGGSGVLARLSYRDATEPDMSKRLYSLMLGGAATLLAGGCEQAEDAVGISSRANSLAQRHLIVDTHIDAPYRHYRDPVDLGEAAPEREFDYPRAREGGLDVAFMSIYTPAGAAEAGEAWQLAERLIDDMESLVATHPERFAIATCTADVARLREKGVVALALGMENGSPLAEASNLRESVDHFFRRGIRYVTLAHSRPNEYSDSSYDINERWGGLSEAGRELVALLNEYGVMIDISHLSDKAAWQVLELSNAPVIASHSSLRYFIPGFHRNMSDDMVKAVAAQGGVVQINFGSGFVSEAARRWAHERDGAMRDRLGDQVTDPAVRRAFMERYREDNPYPFATIETVVDHIERVVELAGVDHVGLGSDFDGVGDTLPVGLKDVGDFPALIDGLLRRGYDDETIAKILGLNLMRAWGEAERMSMNPC